MAKPRLIKFSISMRTETQTKIDQLANEDNRSRSSMIDKACEFYYNHLKIDSVPTLALQKKRV